MDADFDLGNCFKDDLIPLALEYYLGVIDQEDEDDMDDDEEAEEEKPKKGKSKPDEDAGDKPAGAEQKPECKQQ